ncbi:AMP-dependent synthetase and ligase [Gonapodya prolifera JEL478]|uniref:AMP-dependent synthetase and ligase n=1 Tax=Gonapodya prolifera (strain JEL478) TaxID=1344416 RepID=A0A138ZXI1_GONPJ|nr:AMP-dependent synthetase and ligase [Gonapodya prolifera JEL478]|eukprot:KXS09174.1 AMP-dependent synthetase and ligase [Gonapodya prolifera JEL478]
MAELQQIAPPVCSVAEAHALITAQGGPFEIEDKIISGRQYKVWKNALPNIAEVWKQSVQFADRDYLAYTDPFTKRETNYTYAQSHRIVALLCNALARAPFNIAKGDKITICSRNNPEWVLWWWTSVSAGAVTVPVNSWLLGNEMEYCITLADTKVLVVDPERLDRLRPFLAKLRAGGLKHIVLIRADENDARKYADIPEVRTMEQLLQEEDKRVGYPKEVTLPEVQLDPDEEATILFTSGTTGFPKGAVGTHRNYCTNLINVGMSSIRAFVRRGEELPVPDTSIQKVFLIPVPFFHVTGCFSIIGPVTLSGSKLVIMYKWDSTEALTMIQKHKVTGMSSVPSQAIQLLEHPRLDEFDVSSLENWGIGGATSPAEMVGKFRKTITARTPAKTMPGNGYGATETSSVACSNGGEDFLRRPTSVGVVPPVNEVRIVNPDTLEVLPRGQIGEIWLYGPNVIKGYYKDPKKTAETFPGGWYRTGDVGRVDDEGFVYVLDRVKDMIIRGGENIYTAEVENVILAHPAVLDVAVLPIPHRVLGEEVAAVVQLKSGHAVTPEDIAQHCKSRLAAFKIPVFVDLRYEELPKNANGKTLKKEMKQEIADKAKAAQSSKL